MDSPVFTESLVGSLGAADLLILAAAFAALLGAAGVGAGFLVSAPAGWMAAVLALLALLYDAGTKWVPVLGNIVMGSCRSANLLLGAVVGLGSIPAAALFSPGIALALLILVYRTYGTLEEDEILEVLKK